MARSFPGDRPRLTRSRGGIIRNGARPRGAPRSTGNTRSRPPCPLRRADAGRTVTVDEPWCPPRVDPQGLRPGLDRPLRPERHDHAPHQDEHDGDRPEVGPFHPTTAASAAPIRRHHWRHVNIRSSTGDDSRCWWVTGDGRVRMRWTRPSMRARGAAHSTRDSARRVCIGLTIGRRRPRAKRPASESR